ncbi:Helix-turn-helix type 11 domain protein [Hyella patelloides LEGE 07179]|uniref:Helix-turn-helix type 11 domain protein n=1 Tax=Hyella patelloides LEGE 07179 TaxID=945734 RepID=A0A563W041_9CYAN|nr:YafY family protein [Hyella patelloides]VEP17005.1 Helix-turn-helix type 11 domain protein [Hyella patelloides LEGE 07179]
MSRHLERLLKLDSLLRSGVRQTQKSLAEALEVSDRTIRSDLDFLRDRFLAPLEYQKNKGWHYTAPDWRLPSISLSQGELFALTLGARMLENYSGSAYINELRSAIARLSERLPEATWVDLQKIADEKILFSPGASINLDPEIWHKLEKACKKLKSVWMEYFTASRNASSERQLDPYLLHIYRGTNPYVIGFCHKRQEVRWFRIDRIRSLKVLEEEFTVRPDFDGLGHLAMIFQHEVGDVPQPVEIWFDTATAPFVSERRWHPSQELIKHQDGSLTLQMSVSGLNDIKRWVLGYGKGAIVKSPPELVEMVQREIEAMNSNYQQGLKQ